VIVVVPNSKVEVKFVLVVARLFMRHWIYGHLQVNHPSCY
jgi:hypothetical protein